MNPQQTKLFFTAQIIEIQKHKWIESIKAGHDVGELWAATDWIKKYALSFRIYWTNKGEHK